MIVDLKYGKTTLELDTSLFNEPVILESCRAQGIADPATIVKTAMSCPIGSGGLAEEIRGRGASTISVIVNDLTRPTPNDIILPAIVEELKAAGIDDGNVSFVVATGIHRGMHMDEMKACYGADIVRRFKVANHDCDDSSNLVWVGRLSHGTELYLNRIIVESDMVIGTGLISPHYFAGFSGGRKSVLPGVASRASISHNHSLMASDDAATCKVEGNPVSEEMLEAARLCNFGFILNVVTDAGGRICAAVAGDPEIAWREGVGMCRKLSESHIDRLYDVAIASAGGYPKDINVYQAQKALDNAQRAVRTGGAVVLIADCQEGYGEPVFEEWMRNACSPEDVITRFLAGFQLGGHKAYSMAKVMQSKGVMLMSSLSDEAVRSLLMTPVHSIDEAANIVRSKYGLGFSAIVLPNASAVVPVLRR